jgi:hypothetical protein
MSVRSLSLFLVCAMWASTAASQASATNVTCVVTWYFPPLGETRSFEGTMGSERSAEVAAQNQCMDKVRDASLRDYCRTKPVAVTCRQERAAS